MGNTNQCGSDTGNSTAVGCGSGAVETCARSGELRGLIISQLLAAAPASLPLTMIFHGISCSRGGCRADETISAIDQLVQSGSVVKISEHGFTNRYMLSDRYYAVDFDAVE
jgi:hypothetical protein